MNEPGTLSPIPVRALASLALVTWLAGGGALACDTTEPGVELAPPSCAEGLTEVCEDDPRACLAFRECHDGGWTRCSCVSSSIGRACEADDDCGPLELCFDAGAAYLGGAPVAAFCAMPCGEEPTRCERLEPAAVCVVTDEGDPNDPTDDAAHCLERCDVGEADDGKCHGREEMVCAALAGDVEDGVAPLMRPMLDAAELEQAGVCRPVCTSDAQCEDAPCDLRTGACAEPRSGGRFGEACDVDSSSQTCAGICVDFGGVGGCSHRCRLGEAADCAPEGSDNPGLCRFPEADTGSIGDVGFCAELCNCDEECTHPATRCAAFGAATLEALTGRLGVCTPSDDEAVGIACGDAGAP